uniref:EamA domain-containing protein n=1 Tax=Amphora coffeiformis TaxID=265554 RepID=A0A7S3L6W3_9STRA|mmetsp:Transcript_15666/g.29623  ORF Transcript_15666/g.29623 Transcript_15666/m.29623 type:complete len:490 (+) Transcript_15666:275-1744(+)
MMFTKLVLWCSALGGVSSFLAAPPLSLPRTQTSFLSSSGVSHPSRQRRVKHDRPSLALPMAFVGGEGNAALEDVSYAAATMAEPYASDLVKAEADYAVEQSSAHLPWLEQPSLLVGRCLALAAAAIYGTNFAAVKLLSDSLPVSLSASLRFGIGAIATTAVVLVSEYNRDKAEAGEQYFQLYEASEEDPEVIPVSKAELYKERTDAMWAGAEVGLWYAVGYIVQALALLEVDASKSAFFNAAAILVVPVLDMAFKGRPLGLPGAISISLAMFGMGLLQLGGMDRLSESAFSLADVFCACQAIFFGIGYWRLENGAGKFPGQAGRITMGILLGVAFGAFSYSMLMGIVPPPEAIVLTLYHMPMLTASLLWTGLGSTAFALYLETVALKAITATELTILMTSVSLWGSAFAYVTMGETLTPIGMAGGAMLLGGCLVSSLMGEKEPELEASFVLGEDDMALLVSEATDYESIEEAIAVSAETTSYVENDDSA